MSLPACKLESLLRETFPKAEIQIHDLVGDEDHYQVTILSSEFQGKSKIQQHQMVYQALKGKMGQELHALSLKTKALPQ